MRSQDQIQGGYHTNTFREQHRKYDAGILNATIHAPWKDDVWNTWAEADSSEDEVGGHSALSSSGNRTQASSGPSRRKAQASYNVESMPIAHELTSTLKPVRPTVLRSAQFQNIPEAISATSLHGMTFGDLRTLAAVRASCLLNQLWKLCS